MAARVGSRAAGAAALQHHLGCGRGLSLLQSFQRVGVIGSLFGSCCIVVKSGMGYTGLIELLVER
jgi:hypothetical protein